MKNKKALKKYTLNIIALALGILFLIKFGGVAILRLYIQTGIGTCAKIPVLCLVPGETINSEVDKLYREELVPHKFPLMEISIPKGFSVVQEKIKKPYYKKKRAKQEHPIIYILPEEPGFFINLYPQLKKQGITDDYEFLKRIMYANPGDIKNTTDAFFVIMKSIFIPNLGDQRNAKMAEFIIEDKKGFINYNLDKTGNYFDCNVIGSEGAFFKIYIKDKDARLDMYKVLTIISTAN